MGEPALHVLLHILDLLAVQKCMLAANTTYPSKQAWHVSFIVNEQYLQLLQHLLAIQMKCVYCLTADKRKLCTAHLQATFQKIHSHPSSAASKLNSKQPKH